MRSVDLRDAPTQSGAPLMPTLRRVVVDIDLFGHRNHFAVAIMTTCATYVVWAFQLTAVGTFKICRRGQAVMRPAHVTFRPRHPILWDRHNSDLCSYRLYPAAGSEPRKRLLAPHVSNRWKRDAEHTQIAQCRKPPWTVFRTNPRRGGFVGYTGYP